jgi:hypothetical protein
MSAKTMVDMLSKGLLSPGEERQALGLPRNATTIQFIGLEANKETADMSEKIKIKCGQCKTNMVEVTLSTGNINDEGYSFLPCDECGGVKDIKLQMNMSPPSLDILGHIRELVRQGFGDDIAFDVGWTTHPGIVMGISSQQSMIKVNVRTSPTDSVYRYEPEFGLVGISGVSWAPGNIPNEQLKTDTQLRQEIIAKLHHTNVFGLNMFAVRPEWKMKAADYRTVTGQRLDEIVGYVGIKRGINQPQAQTSEGVTVMALTRDAHILMFECDYCHETFDSEESEFDKAWKKLKDEGWLAFRDDKRIFRHFCDQDCKQQWEKEHRK